MGDTLKKVVTEISDENESFKLWDKAQVIIEYSRTKLVKNTLFVGDKQATISAFTSLIQRKKWTDYMESVHNLISVNGQDHQSENVTLNQKSTNFYRICDFI